MKVLAIDIGSSSARVMVVDSEKDYEIKEIHRVKHSAVLDENGNYRWSIDNLFASLKDAASNAVRDHKVDSIGVCSWGVDYGVIGADGKLIDMPYSYRDNRTDKVFDKMADEFSGYKLFESTGIFPSNINTVYQLLSDKEIKRYGKGVKIALIADLFAYYLTGNIRAELSNASTTELLSKSGLDWNYDLIEKLGIDKDIFPEVIKAGEVYGSFNGVSVIAVPTHDTASAIFAMGDMPNNVAFVSSGSWLLVGKVIDEPIISKQVFDIGYTNERICDNKVSLLSNINGLYIIQRISAESGVSYAEIDRTVDSGIVLGEIDVDKLMSPDDMIGNIKRLLGIEKADVIDIVKTAYHSLAVRLVRAIDDIGAVTNHKVDKIIMTGGATKAQYFLDNVKSLSGVEIVLLAGEGAVKGNAMLQVRSLTAAKK